MANEHLVRGFLMALIRLYDDDGDDALVSNSLRVATFEKAGLGQKVFLGKPKGERTGDRKGKGGGKKR